MTNDKSMSESSSVSDVCLPYVCVQPDYPQVYTDVAQGLHTLERVWLSVYSLNAPNASIHAKMILTRPERGTRKVAVELDDAFKGQLSLRRLNDSIDLTVATTSQHGSLLANTIKSAISLPLTRIRTAKRSLTALARGSLGVMAFDVSTSGNGLYVAAGADGQAHVGRLGDPNLSEGTVEHDLAAGNDDIETIAQRRIERNAHARKLNERTYLKGHVGDVRSTRFFPSGEVVLTTSSDCTANVFGIDGSNPRTLKGHRRAVVNSAIVDRGKTVLTSSLDGTTRLWDVGKGEQIASFASESYSAVNTLALTGETTLVTGLSNGSIEAHDLRSRANVFRIPRNLFPAGPGPQASDRWEQLTSGGVNAIDVDGNRLIAGCNDGITALYDLRMLPSESSGAPVVRWRRNGAAVNDIQFISHGQEAIVATADGTPYRVDVRGVNPNVVEEYSGWEVDNVSSCCLDDKRRIWMAGADGLARMYT